MYSSTILTAETSLPREHSAVGALFQTIDTVFGLATPAIVFNTVVDTESAKLGVTIKSNGTDVSMPAQLMMRDEPPLRLPLLPRCWQRLFSAVLLPSDTTGLSDMLILIRPYLSNLGLGTLKYTLHPSKQDIDILYLSDATHATTDSYIPPLYLFDRTPIQRNPQLASPNSTFISLSSQ